MKQFLSLILLVTAFVTQAQPKDSNVGSDFRIPFYRSTPDGKILEARCTGKSAERVSGNDFLVKIFEMKNFHNGDEKDVQFIAQAPECQINPNNQTAFSNGHIDIFTPTTNIYIQGEGFYFEQAKRLLIISNNIETHIVKGLLKNTAMAPSTTTSSNQILKIFSSHFQLDYETRLVHYTDKVHVVDEKTDITCESLSAQLGTNGTVEWILAEQNVVITTPEKGRTTSERAYDIVTNGTETIELTGQPSWHSADQEAYADKFTYDKNKHFLTAIGQVRTKFPNHGTNAAGGFSELFADFATLQMPLTNGPVQTMTADGNVIITNHADLSIATGKKANYSRDTDTFELTGDPVWRDKQMEVKGQSLSMVQSTKSYTAHDGAELKVHLHSGKGGAPTGFVAGTTNQWLHISARLLNFRNGLAAFDNEVDARLLDGEILKGTLRCELLTVRFGVSNQIEKVVAHEAVHVARTPDNLWAEKTLVCNLLTVDRNPATGILRTAEAVGNVVGAEVPAHAGPSHAIIAADRATMFFMEHTNQVEKIIAEGDVSGEKVEPSGKTNLFTGKLATYRLVPEEILEITGDALAKVIFPVTNSVDAATAIPKKNSEWLISGARLIKWDPKSREFTGKGKYHVLPSGPTLPPPHP